MHIAWLTHAELPHPGPAYSGLYDYDQRMARALRAGGHRVDVMTGIPPHGLPPDAVSLIDADAPVEIALCERRQQAAVVHHLPTASHTLLRRVSRVIATSASVAARLTEDRLVEHGCIRLVVPGVDDFPRSAGTAGPGCAILAIGPLIPSLGHDLLLRALARLFDLDWSLTIVGATDVDPGHAADLAALAAASGIAARVRFAGDVDHAARAMLWQQADLFALASRRDNTAIVVAEALRRGVPVAVTGEAALIAAVPHNAGVVCPAEDRDQLSRALRRLIFDPALRRSYADAAFAAGALLPSWSTQAALLVQALDK